MVGILLNSCSPRENSKDLHLSLGSRLEGTTTRVRTSYGVAESELLMENTALRRVQGAMSCKFRIGLHVNKEVKGKAECEVLAANQQSPGVAYFRTRFPTGKSLLSPEDPGDTLSG
jgi:hypothetical protein